MQETTFASLPVISGGATQINALSPGDAFLFEGQAWQQNSLVGDPKAVDLRHKIQYQRRIADEEYPQGVVKTYVVVQDILESDPQAQESKTPTRKGLDTDLARDDDDRNGRILTDPDWS